ncbi:MAG: hypothetical protein K9H64_10310 [Bacteroidales bacterium]|nr:hypothetical protein [Bacteroidales bacterium]MCF8456261.1 hypothetical protein [Bacteroidales bacterium]
MKQNYNFIGNRTEELFETVKEALKGISRVIAMYYSEDSTSLELLVHPKEVEGENKIAFKDKQVVSDFRRKKNDSEWLLPEEIPLHIESQNKIIGKKQSTTDEDEIKGGLFSSFLQNILCIRVPGLDKNGLPDVLLIYFPKDILTFSVAGNNEKLSQSNKQYIGNLIKDFLFAEIKKWDNNVDVHKHTLQMNQRITQNGMNNSKIKTKQITEFAIDLLNEINTCSKKHYSFTQEALIKVGQYTGKLINLNGIIEDAVHYVSNQLYNKSNLLIEADHIQFDPIIIEDTDTLEVRYHNMFNLLNSLEKAIKRAMDEKLDITAKNVCQFLEPKAITQSAITQQLQKNEHKISYLVKKYKNSWPLTLENFKPLRNVLQKEHGLLRNAE